MKAVNFFLVLFILTKHSTFIFSQLQNYSYKDYSSVSKFHKVLDKIYFKADSIVFQGYDSIKNEFKYIICVKTDNAKMHQPILNRGLQNRISLSISLDSVLYENIYNEINATYDSICMKKELMHIITFKNSQFSDIEYPCIGFIKENTGDLIGYKYIADTLLQVKMIYDNRVIVFEAHQTFFFAYDQYVTILSKNGVQGFAFSRDGVNFLTPKWKNILSKKEYKVFNRKKGIPKLVPITKAQQY